MAYTGLTVEFSGKKGTASDGIMNSSFIPAYPQATSSTVYNEAFYWSREQNCEKLIGNTTI